MVDPIFQSQNYQLARKLLDATTLRQEAIASNIANSDTPGYKRLDVAADFATQLRSLVNAGDMQSAGDIQPHLAEDPNARSMRPDGNTVELDRELLEMNRNTVDQSFLSDLVTNNIKQLRMAISGTVS